MDQTCVTQTKNKILQMFYAVYKAHLPIITSDK